MADDEIGMIDSRLAEIEKQTRIVRETIQDDVTTIRHHLEAAFDANQEERERRLRESLQLLDRLDAGDLDHRNKNRNKGRAGETSSNKEMNNFE